MNEESGTLSLYTNNKRIPWIDVAKGIGMILVVIGHCTPPQNVRDTISSFHMPLFFILAGIVFSTKHSNGQRIIKDVKRLFVPYIITCGFIAIFLKIIHYNGGGGVLRFNITIDTICNFWIWIPV